MQELPKSTYVPGISPHPRPEPSQTRHLSVNSERQSMLQWGRQLFCQGFYWESHEAWEAAWIAAGRTGPRADFLKALIKLAACGVKCLEGNQAGARRHAQRAGELFQSVAAESSWATAAGIGPELLGKLESQALRLRDAPPVVTAAQQQSARLGGVPVLEPLPELPEFSA